MTESIYAIYGASGYGREVMPLLREQCSEQGLDGARLFFIDDHATSTTANGYRILTYDNFVRCDAGKRSVAIGIANSRVRQRLFERCVGDGIDVISLVARNTIVMDEVEIGEGPILSPFVTITSNVSIGRGFHANIYSYVAHDCTIGDFVTFAPGAKCNGNVVIEDHAYVGTGAIIRQGEPGKPVVIGEGAIVGMGAVVTKSVAPGTVVVGNPAKPLEKR